MYENLYIHIYVYVYVYIYRVSKKKLTPFIFKLASNLLLEFDNSHVYTDNRTWVINVN